jgi:hypothetical protein
VRDGLSTPILYSRSGTSISGALSFRNNAIFNCGSGNYFTTTGTSTCSNNLFYGNHPSREPADAAKVTSDPEFRNAGNAITSSSYTGKNAYQVHPSSPVIRAGAVIASNGGYDAYGNTVSATAAPNIGAYNGTGGNLLSNAGFETGSLSPWTQASGSGGRDPGHRREELRRHRDVHERGFDFVLAGGDRVHHGCVVDFGDGLLLEERGRYGSGLLRRLGGGEAALIT